MDFDKKVIDLVTNNFEGIFKRVVENNIKKEMNKMVVETIESKDMAPYMSYFLDCMIDIAEEKKKELGV